MTRSPGGAARRSGWTRRAALGSGLGSGVAGALAACAPSADSAPAATASPPGAAAPRPASTPAPAAVPSPTVAPTVAPTATPVSPLAVPALRAREYPASEIRIVRTLAQNTAYVSQLIEYRSDGLKINGVMKVPRGEGPFPVVVLNHGHYSPGAYRSGSGTDNAADVLARAGYLTLASDYRGLGGSENDPAGQGNNGHRPEYTIDVMHLVSSAGSVPQADAGRIGMWGHSMGGEVGLRALEADREGRLKAAVFWAPTSGHVGANSRFYSRGAAPELGEQIGFQLSPINYVSWVAAPLQLHQGDRDREVDPQWTRELHDALQAASKPVELFWYPGQDHNWSSGWGEIAPRTVAFFDRHVKSAPRG